MDAPQPTVSIAQLAREIGISEWFLRRQTEAGRIPYIQQDGEVRYNTRAVALALAEACRVRCE